MSDADMGEWVYEYNAFGELIGQTTGTGDRSGMSYDRLGRMIRRMDFEAGNRVASHDAAWVYDTAPRRNRSGRAVGSALGQLHIEDSVVSGATPIRREYEYDEYGRGRSAATRILERGATQSYVARTTYDQHGRIFQEF